MPHIRLILDSSISQLCLFALKLLIFSLVSSYFDSGIISLEESLSLLFFCFHLTRLTWLKSFGHG